MQIEIKSRWRGNVLFSLETPSLRLALEAGVKQGVNLEGAYLERAYLEGANLKGANLERAYLEGANLKGAYLEGAYLEGANLKGAYLEGAYLEGANLKGAYLEGAYLEGAYLEGANLKGANLEGANLKGAYLEGANLKGAYLEGANLKGAYLKGADLEGANLERADLEGANLTPIRDDFWAVLSAVPSEVIGLRKALIDGKIDGSTYTGDCACLVGTIAKVKGVHHQKLPLLKPNAARPIEIFFLNIKQGDTPESNVVAKQVLLWLDQWVENIKEFAA